VQITGGDRQAVDLRAGDTLVVTAWNSVGGQTLAVRGRCRAVSGSLVDFEGSLLPTADRLASQLTITLDAGALVSVVVSTSIATQRGQTFVRLAIVDSAGNQRAILAQDYVTPGTALAWPGGRISSPTEGPGAIRSITGTDQSPGVDPVEVVPTNARWRLIGFFASLLTSTTVVGRRVQFVIYDGVTGVWTWGAPSDQTASTTRSYFIGPSGAEHDVRGISYSLPAPVNLILRPGVVMRMSTLNLQTGDDWRTPELLVEEWIDV
jgi:hypothetical protein